MKLIDRTGNRYGRLLVLRKHTAPRMWECACDCGTLKLVSGSSLSGGSTQSCGCLSAEWAKTLGSNPAFVAKRAAALATHGHTRGGKSQDYRTWLRMKSRCYRLSDKDYPAWGGRGVRVCDAWRLSFEAFLSDMGPRPSAAHTVDRKDPQGDYTPSNCRWATQEQQRSENKRDLIPVTVDGRSFVSIADACRQLRVKYTTVMQRLYAGIPLAEAVQQGRAKPRRSKESYLPKSKRASQKSHTTPQ